MSRFEDHLVPKARRLNGMFNCHEPVERNLAGLRVMGATPMYLSMDTLPISE